jgi:hypothetical protein
MFTFDRDTAIVAAVAVCIVATIFLYREFGKTKNDLYEMKNLVDKHDSYMYSEEPEDMGEYVEVTEQSEIQEAPAKQPSQPVAAQSA